MHLLNIRYIIAYIDFFKKSHREYSDCECIKKTSY